MLYAAGIQAGSGSQSEPDDDLSSSQDDQPATTNRSTSSSTGTINSLVVRRRYRIKGAALDTLESYYNSNARPSTKDIVLLARIIDEPEQRVRIWFNNRRGKTVRERAMRPTLDEGATIADADQEEHAETGGGVVKIMIDVPDKGMVDLDSVESEDPVVLALKAKILDLQRRLDKHAHPLPPINAMFQSITQQSGNTIFAATTTAASLTTVDLTVFRRGLHHLFTVICATFRQKSRMTLCEIPLHLPTGGEHIERILQSTQSHVRVMHLNSKRHYILTGAELMRISQNVGDPQCHPGECVVTLNEMQRVKVNGVCVVPLSAVKSEDRPVLFRASCTRIT